MKHTTKYNCYSTVHPLNYTGDSPIPLSAAGGFWQVFQQQDVTNCFTGQHPQVVPKMKLLLVSIQTQQQLTVCSKRTERKKDSNHRMISKNTLPSSNQTFMWTITVRLFRKPSHATSDFFETSPTSPFLGDARGGVGTLENLSVVPSINQPVLALNQTSKHLIESYR